MAEFLTEQTKQSTSRKVTVFASHCDQQDETRRYWLGKTIAEKMEETASLIRYAYALQGTDVDAQGSERILVRFERPRR